MSLYLLQADLQEKKADYPTLFGVIRLDQPGTYIVLAVVLVLLMMLTWNLVHGQMGRARHAMRGSQVAAQAMGISLLKYRLVAFALATVYASLAGAMYVHFINFVYPSTWILPISLNILAMIVIGGTQKYLRNSAWCNDCLLIAGCFAQAYSCSGKY